MKVTTTRLWARRLLRGIVPGGVLILLGFALIPLTAETSYGVPTGSIKDPQDYGTLTLDKRTGPGTPMREVRFPHWLHRSKFTCKVCHTDIGFPFKRGGTEITMTDVFNGKYCGECHNGDVAFSPMSSGACDRCHSKGIEVPDNTNFEEFTKDFPKSGFGNKIDWVKALREGHITPKASKDGTEEMFIHDADIILPVTKFKPAPADVLYPHKAHTEWLTCVNCHPSIFNMSKGGNPDMSMIKIISGQYCGKCHGRVSFPLENCFKCHSQPTEVDLRVIAEEERKKKEEEERKKKEEEEAKKKAEEEAEIEAIKKELEEKKRLKEERIKELLGED